MYCFHFAKETRMETQLQTMEIPILELSSPGCQVGGVGKLVNNAGEPKRGGNKCWPPVGGGGFFFLTVLAQHMKRRTPLLKIP